MSFSMIPELVSGYMEHSAELDKAMEECGAKIAKGDFSLENLKEVCRWKSPRRIGLLDENSSEKIERSLRRAFDAADVEDAVHALVQFKGVGVKMASAILTAIDPGRYTVLDYRALEALGCEDNDEIGFYAEYVAECQRMAKEFGVTLRDFDRANWQWSKNKSEGAGL